MRIVQVFKWKNTLKQFQTKEALSNYDWWAKLLEVLISLVPTGELIQLEFNLFLNTVEVESLEKRTFFIEGASYTWFFTHVHFTLEVYQACNT